MLSYCISRLTPWKRHPNWPGWGSDQKWATQTIKKTNRKASFLASLELEVRSPALHKGSFFPPSSAGTSSLGNKRGNNCLRSRRAVCKVCLPSAAWNDDGNSGASCTRASAPNAPSDTMTTRWCSLGFDAATATTRSPSGERYPSDVDLLMCCAAHSGAGDVPIMAPHNVHIDGNTVVETH